MAGSILVDRIQTNLTGYTVQEDATPIDPSMTTGGVGQIDFEADWIEGPEGSIQLQGLDVELRDQWRGLTFGTITDAELTDSFTVSLTASGRLGSLVGNVSAKPMVDTLANVSMYYLQLGGITDGIVIDPDIAFIPVSVPGFNDDLWLRFKQLISVAGCEIALVSNKVVIRPVRSFDADTSKQTSLRWAVNKGDAAQSIEVTYYGNTWVGGDIVYPYTEDERKNAQSWQVDDGAVLEDDITTSVSLASVEQPFPVDYVPQDFGRTTALDDNDTTNDAPDTLVMGSVYSVYDANNLLVPAAVWRSNGGKIELTVNDDTTSVHVKITAPLGVGKAPYRIVGRTDPTGAKSVTNTKTTTDYNKKDTKKDNVTTTTFLGITTEYSDEGEDYPSLFIAGTGVAVNPQVITIPTGIAASTSVTEIGTTVQVPTVSDIEDAYRIGVQVAKSWTGSQQTVSGTLTSINQISGSGSIKYRSVAQFNADYAGKSIAQFNSQWAGKTFDDFNDSELAKVKDEFENQVFGNVAGARLRYGDAMYRIDSATVTNEDISITASSDTTIADFNDAFAGMTFADFDDRFAGKSFVQFNRTPLTQKISTGTIYVPPVPTATTPYPDTFYPDQLNPAGTDDLNIVDNGDGTLSSNVVTAVNGVISSNSTNLIVTSTGVVSG